MTNKWFVIQVQKLREKIAAQREKRRIKETLSKVKKLGESDSEDESASAWVKKSRALAKEKELAEKKVRVSGDFLFYGENKQCEFNIYIYTPIPSLLYLQDIRIYIENI